jgi:hypothetical protein
MGNDPAFQQIAHTDSTAEIEWFASGSGWDHLGDGGADDESWAIDDIFVAVWRTGDAPAIRLIRVDNDTFEVSFKGLLQISDNLIEWLDATPQPICPWLFEPSGTRKFFRARDY